MQNQVFKLHYDRTTIVLTVLTFLVVAIAAFTFNFNAGSSPNGESSSYSPIVGWLASALFILAIMSSLLFAPLGYIISGDSFIVRKIISPVKVKAGELESVERLGREEMRGLIRVFGSGGLFGYWGLFRNNHLGDFRLYVGERKNYILLTLKSGKKIVVAGGEDLFNALGSLTRGK